jgi:hypothetical protein
MKLTIKKIMAIALLTVCCKAVALGWFGWSTAFKPVDVEFRAARDGDKKYVSLSIYYKNGQKDEALDVGVNEPLKIAITDVIDEIYVNAEQINPQIVNMINDRIANAPAKKEAGEGFVNIQVQNPTFEIKQLSDRTYTIGIKA